MLETARGTEPTVGEIRRTMPEDARQRSFLKAMLVFVPTAVAYLGLLAALIASPWQWSPLLGGLIGVVLGIGFVISHDAAHGAFTPYRWLNAVIARLTLLTTWHSYTGWVHAHNHIHHGWTNLRTKDYVWSPLKKSEYDKLSAWNRGLVRLYRSGWGVGVYWFVEILCKKVFWIQSDVQNPKVRRAWLLDDMFLVAGIVAHGAAIVGLARGLGVQTHAAWLILWGQVVPAMLSSHFIGFITWLQHTHPEIPWFDEPHEWSFYMGQIRGTAHIHFPHGINKLFHNVMEHTAHHVDPRIPLYNLPAAQEDLETAWPGDVIQSPFAFRKFFHEMRLCQLYDYDNHRWQNFAGEYTSDRPEFLPHAEAWKSSEPAVVVLPLDADYAA